MLCFVVHFPLAINSVMAQFNVNPYHWPGWMLAALTTAVAVCAFFFFVETRSFSRARPSCKTVSYLVGLKLEAQLQSKCKSIIVSDSLVLYREGGREGGRDLTDVINKDFVNSFLTSFEVLFVSLWLWVPQWDDVHCLWCTYTPSPQRPIWLHSGIHFPLSSGHGICFCHKQLFPVRKNTSYTV